MEVKYSIKQQNKKNEPQLKSLFFIQCKQWELFPFFKPFNVLET